MSSDSPPLAARERAELADLLDRLGADAPTCCEGWRTAHLAAHLVVRDRRPDALLGLGLETIGLGGPMAAWTHRVEDRLRGRLPYSEVVARVRSGPPRWVPIGWPGIAALVNTGEFTIHHEDVRRAQPGWTPRAVARADQDQLWRLALVFARAAAARVPGGLTLCRADVPGVSHRVGGRAPRQTVEGEPLELLLWASGRRDVARITLS